MSRSAAPLRFEQRWQQQIGDHVIALAWSPDGAALAAASVSGPIAILDTATGKLLHKLKGHGFGTTAISWRPSTQLASAGQDGTVRIWNTQIGQEVTALAGGSAWVEHVAWGPKDDFLVSAAGKKLRLWHPDGRPAKTYPDSLTTISALAWSPRGKELVAGGYGGVTFFRPDADAPVNQFAWKGAVIALAWSPDGKMLAGGGQDATVHFWYVKSGEDLQMAGYPLKVSALAWDRTSRYLATGGSAAVTVWDCSGKGPAGSKPLTFELHEAPVAALAFQQRGPILASVAADGKVALWEPGNGIKPLAHRQLNEAGATLSWSPGDGRLVVGGESGAVTLYCV